jgi:hypothetical protein
MDVVQFLESIVHFYSYNSLHTARLKDDHGHSSLGTYLENVLQFHLSNSRSAI